MLPDSQSIFRSLLEAAPDGILVVDETGIIAMANARCQPLFGYAPQELQGQAIEILLPQTVRQKHRGLRQGYFGEPRTRPMGIGMHLTARHRDGHDIPVEISLSPFNVDDQRHAIAIVRDVTELRRLDREIQQHLQEIERTNTELARSNKELEQFAYVASHDLQEPLRVISGYTQLLQRRYGDKLDATAQEYIASSLDSTKRLQQLIDDLLTFSRVSSRAKSFATVDLKDVLQVTISNLSALIDETQAQIIASALPNVTGDKTQIIQLFQNLLANALKFRRPDMAPEVHISASRDGDFWRITVADNGIGIAAHHAEKIFVIFQRLHSREKYPGTGIGLAICKKIIERHGGKIWLDTSVAQGATFHFTLPVAAVEH